MITALYSSVFVTIATIAYFFINGITDNWHLALMGINSFISCLVIFHKEDKPFTTHKIINLFIFIFFIVANGSQFLSHSNVLTFSYQFTEDSFIDFQFQVLLILIGYNLGYYYFTMRSKQRKLKPYTANEEFKSVNTKLLIIVSAVACALVIAHFAGNPMKLLVRGVEDDIISPTRSASQTSGLLFGQFIRPIPICCLIIALIAKCPRKPKVYLWILALIALFPTALARNQAAMYWLPILIICFDQKLRHNVAMWLFMFAIFVLFPFFNLFRRFDGNINFKWSMDFFNEIDFDASQIFMAVTGKDFQTAWEQILGPLFFYIPRSWWPDKPVGSGHELVTSFHGYFSNVSMPYFGEGYVNGGWLGVGIFTIFLAWLCAKMDYVYYSKWLPRGSFKQGYYLFLIGALIFIMRGDLLSSTAYTVGTMCCYAFCLFLATNSRFFKIRFK